jgi:subtilisin-like proprotein convertase family protein
VTFRWWRRRVSVTDDVLVTEDDQPITRQQRLLEARPSTVGVDDDTADGAVTATLPARPIPDPPGPGVGLSQQPFLFRDSEVERFRALAGLADEAAPDGTAPRLVVVVGPSGVGKRTLLRELRRESHGRVPARTGPAIDLREPPQIEDMLEQISLGLDPEPRSFKELHAVLRRRRARAAGRRSPATQVTEIAQRSTATVNETFPHWTTGAARAVGELAAMGVEAAEGRRDVDAFAAFREGFTEYVQAVDGAPVVLFFTDVDRWPDEAAVTWIRKLLLPFLLSLPVLVVTSVESDQTAETLQELGRTEVWRLPRFDQAETRQFVVRVLKIPSESRLGRSIVEDSGGFPQRLARYHSYFERYGSVDPTDPLPDAAREWAGATVASEPLRALRTDFAKRLFLYASPLRWENAELLRRVAHAAGLDTSELDPGDLLQAEQRPPWIVRVGPGWGIDDSSRRRGFVEECRRLDPAVYTAVHRCALHYHFHALVAFDRKATGATNGGAGHDCDERGDAAPTAFIPHGDPDRRLADSEYVASLAEWLYHLMAVEPEKGLGQLADHVSETLVNNYHAAALRLVDLGPELRLRPHYVMLVRALGRLAQAMRDDDYEGTIGCLDELRLTPPTRFTAGVVEFLRGTMARTLGRPEVLEYIRAAEAEFSQCDRVPAIRQRCLNLTWMAYLLAEQDADSSEGERLLERVRELATDIGEVDLMAEAARVRGLIAVLRRATDEARARYDEAQSLLRRAGRPSAFADVLRDSGGLYASEGEFDRGRRDLINAMDIYRRLDEPGKERDAALELLSLELKAGDEQAAERLRQRVMALSDADPSSRSSVGRAFARNAIGVAYHNAALAEGERERELALWRIAVEEFASAEKLASKPVFLSNLGRAQKTLADLLASDDAEKAALYVAAQDNFEAAFRAAPDDVDLGLELLDLLGIRGNAVDAARVGSTLRDQLSERGRTLHETHGEVPRDLLNKLVRALEPLDPSAAAWALDEWKQRFPDNAELQFLAGIAWSDAAAGGAADWTWGSPLERARWALSRACDLARPADGAASGADEQEDQAGVPGPAEGERVPSETRLRYLTALADLHLRTHRFAEAEAVLREAADLDETNSQVAELSARSRRLRRRDAWLDKPQDVFSSPVEVEVATDLLGWVDPAREPDHDLFERLLPTMRAQIAARTGVVLPGVRVREDASLESSTFAIRLGGVLQRRVRVPGDYLAEASPGACVDLHVDAAPAVLPWNERPAARVGADAVPGLIAAGIGVWDPRGVIVATLADLIARDPAALIGVAYASSIVADHDWSVRPQELPRVTELLRHMAAARVAPEDVEPARVRALLDAEPPTWPAIAGALALPRPSAGGDLAGSFTIALGERPPTGAPTLRIGLSSDVDSARIRQVTQRVVQAMCGPLSLPLPIVEVDRNAEYGPDEFTVTVDGTPRVAGRLGQTLREMSRRYGPFGEGRTGACVFPESLDARVNDDALVGRCVEEVVFDDPGLFVGPPSTSTEFAEPAAGTADAWPAATELTRIQHALASRRVPLPEPDRLAQQLKSVRAERSAVLRASRMGPEAGSSVRFESSTSARAIPDDFEWGIRDSITVPLEGRLKDLKVTVAFRHAYPGELSFVLTTPQGRRVVLPSSEQGGGTGWHLLEVDTRTHPPLAACLGASPAGQWILRATDRTASDAGTLVGWALEVGVEGIGTQEEDAAPELVESGDRAPAMPEGAPPPPDVPEPHAPAARLDVAEAADDDAGLRRLGEVERLIRELSPHDIDVLLASDLHARLKADDPASDLRSSNVPDALARVTQQLGRDLAGDVRWVASNDLEPGRYAIVINRLPRAAGDLRLGRARATPDAVPAEGGDVDAAGFSDAWYLAAHLAWCLEEAAGEFIDLDWAEGFVARVSASWPSVGDALRNRYELETLAATLHRLAAVPAALTSSRLLDALLDYGQDSSAAGAHTAPATAADADSLASFVSARLADLRIVPWLEQPGSAQLFELPAKAEAAARDALARSDAVEPIYGVPRVGSLLHAVRVAVATCPLDARAAVVTSPDLRRHIRRAIAAQFPHVPVFGRDEIAACAAAPPTTPLSL